MIVVADTSVLLNLSRVGRANLLRELFHEVVIPPEVATEFERLVSDLSRFHGLALPGWIRQQRVQTIPAMVRSAEGLDLGETAALSLAIEIHADAILIDERRGHQIALLLGLKAIGILGILIQAKTLGLLPAVRPVLEQLEREALFWIGPELRNRVLRIVGE